MGDSLGMDTSEMHIDDGKSKDELNLSNNFSIQGICQSKSDAATSNVQDTGTDSVANDGLILAPITAEDISQTSAGSCEEKVNVSSDLVSGTKCEHTVPVESSNSVSPETANNNVASINFSNSETTEVICEHVALVKSNSLETGAAESEDVAPVTDNSSKTDASEENKHVALVTDNTTGTGAAEHEYVASGTDKTSSELGVVQNEHVTSVAYESKQNNTPTANDYEFDGECYCYTDKESGITYKFDNDKQEWVIKETRRKSDIIGGADNGSEDEDDDIDEDGNKKRSRFVKQDMSAGVYSYEGDTHVYTDPTDGTKYMWDKEKNAWFPKIDEDFLAHYQMSYGFLGDNTKDTEPEEQKKVENIEDKSDLKRKAPAQPTWFEIDEEHNNKVYVNNLPEDITEQEYVDIMQKCGLIMKDPDTGKLKIKLYTVPGSDQLKGDGLCTYIRIESVDLALKVLDGYELRGHKLSVERAKFQMKGDYNPTLKPKKRRKKDKEKIKKIQEKLLDWRPDMLRGERPKHERVVVVKNLFEPSLFENNIPLILEYQQDLREECSKFGVVRKVVIQDRHPEGVAQIFFSDPEEADICVKFLNGRWYSQRQLKAETWDGKTKYRIVETEEQTKERLAKWASFLEKGEEGK